MCRKQIFSEWPETPQNILEKIIKNPRQRWRPGGPYPFHEGGGGCPLPRGPPGPPPTSTPTPYIHVRGEKNQREGFIAFYDTEPPPSPKLSLEGWSGVRSGLRRGGFITVIIINHPPSPISWCSPPCVINSIVGLLGGDGLDEIYHVIKLVLLGLIPSIHYVLRLMLLWLCYA